MSTEHNDKPSPWAKAARKLAEEPQDSNREETPAESAPAPKKSPYGGQSERAEFRGEASPYEKSRREESHKPYQNDDRESAERPKFDRPRSDRSEYSVRFDERKPRTKAESNPYERSANKPVYGKTKEFDGKKPYRDTKDFGDKKPYTKRTEAVTGSALYGEKKAEGLHKNNPHNGRYDMAALVNALPALDKYLMPNPSGEQTIDFSNPNAVLTLNKALLAHHYNVVNWQLPTGYLCPPIPGRADYLHHLSDLLMDSRRVVKNTTPKVLDVGTGANLIYPIIGSQTFGWEFTASDVDGSAITNAHRLVADNPVLSNVKVMLQRNEDTFFKGIIREGDYFELTLCNPPFFKSQQEAENQARRKWRNLKGDNHSKRNFGGKHHELWCEGGELAFLNRMIEESVQYAKQVGWFTALVSQQDHIPLLKRTLRGVNAQGVTVVPMAQGQKHSRFIAWYFE